MSTISINTTPMKITPMNIFINGQSYQLTSEPTVQQALTLFLSEQQRDMSFAVALNGDFVEKSSYQTTQVTTNDSIDVLFPIVGG